MELTFGNSTEKLCEVTTMEVCSESEERENNAIIEM
jgi:hypothetical protein